MFTFFLFNVNRSITFRCKIFHFHLSGATKKCQAFTACFQIGNSLSACHDHFSLICSDDVYKTVCMPETCKIWDPGSLFRTAGAERCGVLTFGRVGWEVKSNTNKVWLWSWHLWMEQGERGRDENTVIALEITGLSFFLKNDLRLIFSS